MTRRMARRILRLAGNLLLLSLLCNAYTMVTEELPLGESFKAQSWMISQARAESDESDRGIMIKKKEEITPELVQPPSAERPPMPGFLPQYQHPAVSLPPVVPPPEGRLSTGPKVYVREFVYSGNTVVPTDDLKKLSVPYENRSLTNEELDELRDKLTSLYIERGYINSGAIIPDQKITNGAIRVRIIEGRLSETEIMGSKRLRPSYIRDRIKSPPPFNIHALQEKLLLLGEDPRIRRITSQLVPGINRGDAVLKVAIEEERPYQLGMEFNNHRSPSIGGLHGEVFAVHRNISGFGDTLGVRYGKNSDGKSNGGDEISLSYAIPLTRSDTSLRIYYDYQNARVVENPFDVLDIKSKEKTFGISVTQPVFRTLSNDVRLTLSAEKRQTKSYLLGEPFSFSEGVEDGKADVTALRFMQEWEYRSPRQVFALRSILSWGIDALGATTNSSTADGRFLSWLFQIQWARLIEKLNRTQIIFRTDLQLSRDPLLGMEKFAVGGATSVRGYRENELYRDQGLVSSLECRIPIYRLSIPRVSGKPMDGAIQLAPFFDWGWSENVDEASYGPRTISSIGMGLRWNPNTDIHANLYWGYALRKIDHPHKDMQDKGFHFQVSATFF